ncbi:MAG TPA: hypothetical protein VG985_00980 [Xanthobacteraceae bacterium]|nr:hypothetical protein [Xanthobacteraceae bacterium]
MTCKSGRRVAAFGLAGVLALSAATPGLAREFHHRHQFYGPGYAYGRAYGFVPGPYDPGPFVYRGWRRGPVGYKASGEAFSESELGPGCSYNQKQLDRC